MSQYHFHIPMRMIWILIEAFAFIWAGLAGRSLGLFSIKLCVRWTILLVPWDHLRDNTVYSLTKEKEKRQQSKMKSIIVFSAWHVDNSSPSLCVCDYVQWICCTCICRHWQKLIQQNIETPYVDKVECVYMKFPSDTKMCQSVLLTCCDVSWNNFILLF